jgi:DNA-directed RNA polymerase subunit RPC12/RpoP
MLPRESKTRCPRCGSRRIEGDVTCPRCGWRFEVPQAAATTGEPAPPITFVEIRPDPFERRQVARWVLALFEISVFTSLAGLIGWGIGGSIGSWLAGAIGNDFGGILLSGLIWGAVAGTLAIYATLRYMAR